VLSSGLDIEDAVGKDCSGRRQERSSRPHTSSRVIFKPISMRIRVCMFSQELYTPETITSHFNCFFLVFVSIVLVVFVPRTTANSAQ
jgi:hypothetical protein